MRFLNFQLKVQTRCRWSMARELGSLRPVRGPFARKLPLKPGASFNPGRSRRRSSSPALSFSRSSTFLPNISISLLIKSHALLSLTGKQRHYVSESWATRSTDSALSSSAWCWRYHFGLNRVHDVESLAEHIHISRQIGMYVPRDVGTMILTRWIAIHVRTKRKLGRCHRGLRRHWERIRSSTR